MFTGPDPKFKVLPTTASFHCFYKPFLLEHYPHHLEAGIYSFQKACALYMVSTLFSCLLSTPRLKTNFLTVLYSCSSQTFLSLSW